MENFSYIGDFKRFLIDSDKSIKTISGYVTDVLFFIDWYVEKSQEAFKPELVLPVDIRLYRDFLHETLSLAPSSIKRKLSSLNSFFLWALEANIVLNNPVKGIKSISQSVTAPKWLSKNEICKFLRIIDRELYLSKNKYPVRWLSRHRDCLIALTFLFTGIRVNEGVALTLNDVQISDRSGYLVIRSGKGKKHRKIPLNKSARNAIDSWLSIRPESDLPNLWLSSDNNWQKPLTSRTIQRSIQRLGLEAGINLHPHVLRHTYAKQLIDLGIGIEKVAVLLGHSNINTTSIYITPSLQDLQEAVDKIEL
ncbi:MAG: hypothetical protein CL609_22795 [Anaerolineaceae bacterium]|nr:hypothetical protein [Anaerolineaceae bacterium]